MLSPVAGEPGQGYEGLTLTQTWHELEDGAAWGSPALPAAGAGLGTTSSEGHGQSKL